MLIVRTTLIMKPTMVFIIDNAYLYVDSRDTFDGIGIANGTISGSGSFQIGRIDFLDSTDFVNVDYLAILDTVYEAFDSHGSLLSSFNAAPGTGSFSLSGGIISYLTFKALGGYGAISGLSYNYDGITDGRNDDLSQVPVPAAVWLFGSGLMGLLGFNRKRSQSLAV